MLVHMQCFQWKSWVLHLNLSSSKFGCQFWVSIGVLGWCFWFHKRFMVPFRPSLSWQVNYGNFMHGLMKENIQLNRKVLSEISMHEPYSFKALVDISRTAFPGNKPAVAPKKEGLAILIWTSILCWGRWSYTSAVSYLCWCFTECSCWK